MGDQPQQLLPVETIANLVVIGLRFQHGLACYVWTIPPAAPGIDKLYLDLFNAAGSGKILRLHKLLVVPQLDVASAPVLSVRTDCYRTSAVGTGGTTAPYKSATRDVAGGNISPVDTNNAALPAQVTARALPTGGATISEWLTPFHSISEETFSGVGYNTQSRDAITILPYGQIWTFREGQGLLVKQGGVASAGSIGFIVGFSLE